MLSDMFQKSTNLVDERGSAKNRPHGTLFAGTWLSQKLTKIPPRSYNLFFYHGFKCWNLQELRDSA